MDIDESAHHRTHDSAAPPADLRPGVDAAPADRPGPRSPEPLVVDCAACALQGTHACDDCLVTFVLDRPATGPVRLAAEDLDAVRVLTGAGLVPQLRLVQRAG